MAMTLKIVLVVTITLMIAIKVAMILMIADCGDDDYMKIAILRWHHHSHCCDNHRCHQCHSH